MTARSRFAIWSYGLAFLGAHLAFMPLFVLLLPRRVAAIAPDNSPVVLSLMLLVGGIVAGLANVASGAFSDRWIRRFGNRRGLIAIGGCLIFTSYIAFALAPTVELLFAAMIYFQLALNCCFAPLGVLLADHFPDEMKGRLGGILSATLPASILLIVPVATLFPQDNPIAFLLVGTASVACMVPLLAVWRLGAAIGSSGDAPSANLRLAPNLKRDFALAWLSRLLVQTGAAFAISYIYLYIVATDIAQQAWQGADASEFLAVLTAPAAILAIIASLLGGAFSDSKAARRVPLFMFACVFGAGLGLLAGGGQLLSFLIAYGLVQIGLAAFLSVDAALVAQIVAGQSARGLLLGIMNLSNTLPSIIAPSLALVALSEEGLAGALSMMFGGFAFAAVLSGFLVLLIRSVR